MYTRAKVYGAAENIKPYVDRAMSDDKLRGDLAAGLPHGERSVPRVDERSRRAGAHRSTRCDRRRHPRPLRDAIDDLRSASERLKGKPDHSARNTTLLLVGITLGLLYNPVTGPETRRFIKDMLSGGELRTPAAT